ncbi:MAG: polymerase subunit gamma and tau [Nocardioides sp.]|nr:polymerase subunit gamma and tau [Nocardioides sp.]
MESPLALYRRYRPETFQEVIGQEHVTEPLRAALANNRVNHAYLFSGPRGCGKTTSARILARTLNCDRAPVADPCGECDSCRDLARGGPGSIDVIEIDAASHGGVDDARDLREKAFFAPVRSRYKVYIIDEAHMVTTQGFNALLKLVEEPPPHLRFIFATTEPDKVLPTIRSRTHHYPFRLIPPRLLSTYLSELCDKEGVSIEPAAVPLLVRAGGGSARDTLSVLDQLLGGAGDEGVTHALATGLLGYTPDTLLDEVVDAFAAGDGAAVFGVVDKVIETGQDPRRFTEDLLRRLRDLVIVDAVPDAPATGLIDCSQDQGERLVAQAARFGSAELSRAADLVATGLTEMRGATAPRLLLELICARVLLPGADHATNGVLARLDRLEKRAAITGTPSTPASAPAPAAPAQDRPTTASAPPDVEPPLTINPVIRPLPPTSAPAQPTLQAPDPEGAGSGATASGERAAPEVAPPGAVPTVAPPATADAGPPAGVAGSGSEARNERAGSPAGGPAGAGAGGAPAADVPVVPASPEPDRPPAAAPGGLTLIDVRRLWPDIVEATKLRRRVTWMHLAQNCQVISVEGKVLTLGFSNAGARESFDNGGSAEIVRQAAIDVVGADWRIETIVDPGAKADPTAPRVTSPAVPEPAPSAPPVDSSPSAPPAWASDDADDDPAPPQSPAPQPVERAPKAGPESVAAARGAIKQTREAGSEKAASSDLADADADAHPDDLDAETQGLDGAELLRRELGAQVIDEIRHQ